MSAGQTLKQIPLRWKLLVGFFMGCMFADMAAWVALLTTICSSNPRKPVAETQHVIAHSCHGMTVFLSPLQEAMLIWLMPLLLLLIVLFLVSVGIALLSVAKVRIDVQIHRADP